MDSETEIDQALHPEVLQEYLDALHASVALANSMTQYPRVREFRAQWGPRYVKIMQWDDGRASSVHAFIERSTSHLIKPAGLNAPQRNSDGSLSVRFRLADEAERAALCEELRQSPQAAHGGYLYQR